jgi:hypothetical protein
LTPAAQGNAVVSIAMRYLGVPYQWGGARPKTGFDCSGLVQFVFAQLGVALPHYAAGQFVSADGVWVAPNRLQPGDLVFFAGSDGTRQAPGHVGIYVGDGYLIDAPHTGSFVRVDSLDDGWFANTYAGARRIVGASLDARHLLHASEQAVSFAAPLFPRQLSSPVSDEALGSPAVGIAAHAAAPRYGLWGGASLGGFVLLLFAGAVPYRRRFQRQFDGESEGESGTPSTEERLHH